MSARHLAAADLRAPNLQASKPHIRGLPGALPPGEALLWQGAPRAGTLAVQAFHVRLVAAYFAMLIAASAITAARHGAGVHALGLVVLHRAALAGVLFALVAAYTWAVERSTTYTITSERVVLSFGIALPMSFNLPFSRIEAAGLRLYNNGAGDLTLTPLPGERLSYLMLWPHARPWRLGRAEPMLRCIPAARDVSDILAQALAEHARVHGSAAAPSRRAVRLPQGQGLAAMVLA